MADAPNTTTTPDFLAIGHATQDIAPGDGWRLGGTVTFAALTAKRLGLRTAIVTSGPLEIVEALRQRDASIPISHVPSTDATTFENIYRGSTRSQFLRARAAPLTLDAVPSAWRSAPIVLLAPLAREVDSRLIAAFPHSLVAATPQGWLRTWNETTGFVSPGRLDAAVEAALPGLAVLILSRDDLLATAGHEATAPYTAASAENQIARWAQVVPIVAITRGAEGATLMRHGHAPESFPGYQAREVDPTGAGDVFAAAFLCHLHATGDARAATDYANQVAAMSIEHVGATGIPTPSEVAARFPLPR